MKNNETAFRDAILDQLADARFALRKFAENLDSAELGYALECIMRAELLAKAEPDGNPHRKVAKILAT